LGACIDSILCQTCGDFEILIMDDCSPDNTESVARSYQDPRVKYVRNEQNLGNIRNYNKGIELARGTYIWLISADDLLKQPYVLNRYVEVMEANPAVGFIFSPAIALVDGEERGVIEWTTYGDSDRVVNGHEFLLEIMNGNCVAAPAAMVRKACYQTVSLFPVDLFHAGDWYLWCAFALHFDVAYLAEPMTLYRTHGDNMSLALRRRDEKIVKDNLRLARWRLRAKARSAQANEIAFRFDRILANKYAYEVARGLFHGDSTAITVADFEAELKENVAEESERRRFRAEMFGALGDQAFQASRLDEARMNYATAMKEHWLQPKLWAKRLLLGLGASGSRIRRMISTS
jgi:glycosyltransferase involved in cell wall biosynthesis